MAPTERDGSVFSESELIAAFSRVMPKAEATQMAALCMRSDDDGEASTFTQDTLLLVSLQSEQLAERVERGLAHTFLGPGGESRRAEWDRQRAAVKVALDSNENRSPSS